MHVTMTCVTKSYTSLGESYHQQMYVANPSSTRAALNHRGIYVRGVTVWRQDVTYLSRAYETDRPTPLLTSKLSTLTTMLTVLIQWKRSWIRGRK